MCMYEYMHGACCFPICYRQIQMLKIEWKVPRKKEWLGEFQGLEKEKEKMCGSQKQK